MVAKEGGKENIPGVAVGTGGGEGAARLAGAREVPC